MDGQAKPGSLIPEEAEVAANAIVVCGWGEVGRSVSAKIEAYLADEHNGMHEGAASAPQIVAFSIRANGDESTSLFGNHTRLIFGDGANPAVIQSSGVTQPRAIFVTYSEHERCLAACSRLRFGFLDSPIYSRAQTREEAQDLIFAGATEVVVEFDELSRSAEALLKGTCLDRMIITFTHISSHAS